MNIPMFIQPFGMDTINKDGLDLINYSNMVVYEIAPQKVTKKVTLTIIPSYSSEWIIGYNKSDDKSEFICIGATTEVKTVELKGYEFYFGARFDESGSYFNKGLGDKMYPSNMLNNVFTYIPESSSSELALIDSFKKTDSFKEKAKAFTAFLKNSKEFYPIPSNVAEINAAILESKGSISVYDLSEKFGYSERHINRLYKEAYGFGPKDFGKYVRFQGILKEIASNPDRENSQFILGTGYSDQAHFQREFKSFTGITPKQYAKSLI